jgi:hypothetical protein
MHDSVGQVTRLRITKKSFAVKSSLDQPAPRGIGSPLLNPPFSMIDQTPLNFELRSPCLDMSREVVTLSD